MLFQVTCDEATVAFQDLSPWPECVQERPCDAPTGLVEPLVSDWVTGVMNDDVIK